jgi:hypothetical protein
MHSIDLRHAVTVGDLRPGRESSRKEAQRSRQQHGRQQQQQHSRPMAGKEKKISPRLRHVKRVMSETSPQNTHKRARFQCH